MNLRFKISHVLLADGNANSHVMILFNLRATLKCHTLRSESDFCENLKNKSKRNDRLCV